MRKSGLQLLLSSMGIEINPEELMQKYNESKEIMPKLAAFVAQLDARLERLEKMVIAIGEDQGLRMENFKHDTGGTGASGVRSIARTGTGSD